MSLLSAQQLQASGTEGPWLVVRFELWLVRSLSNISTPGRKVRSPSQVQKRRPFHSLRKNSLSAGCFRNPSIGVVLSRPDSLLIVSQLNLKPPKPLQAPKLQVQAACKSHRTLQTLARAARRQRDVAGARRGQERSNLSGCAVRCG